MNDAEGAEDDPVIHFIKITQDLRGKCTAILLLLACLVCRPMLCSELFLTAFSKQNMDLCRSSNAS